MSQRSTSPQARLAELYIGIDADAVQCARAWTCPKSPSRPLSSSHVRSSSASPTSFPTRTLSLGTSCSDGVFADQRQVVVERRAMAEKRSSGGLRCGQQVQRPSLLRTALSIGL